MHLTFLKFAIVHVVLLLLFLPGHLPVYNDCYENGPRWSDLGSDFIVDVALRDLCEMMKGTARVGDTILHCININDSHLVGSIQITDGPAGNLNVNFWNCLDLLTQAKSRCPEYGGELQGIETQIEVPGGSQFTATVKLDPQRDNDFFCQRA